VRIVANPASRSVPTPQYLAVAHETSPYITVYPWKTNVDGFGTKYADIPSGGPNLTVNDAVWTSNNSDILFGKGGSFSGSPWLFAYSWTFYGFGTKYADAANQPGDGLSSIALNLNNRDTAVTFGTFSNAASTEGLQSYPFTSGTGWGTKYSAPPNRPATATSARGAAFRPQRNTVSVGTGASPFVYLVGYSSSSGGFTTKFADPGLAIQPPSAPFNSSWGPLRGIDVAFAHANSPYVTIYQWSPSTGIVAKWTDPATSIGAQSRDVQWNPAENAIAMATVGATTPFVVAYEWDTNTGWGSRYSDPSTLPPNSALGVSWRNDGTDIAVAHVSSPYITVYSWSNGFGTKYSNPTNLPAGNANKAKFSF